MNCKNEIEERDGLVLIHYDAVVVRRDNPKLAHSGVKGQKWGVRNGPPYPLDRQKKKVEKTNEGGIVKSTVEGHSAVPPKGVPNSICDHIDENGKVDKRGFYDENGWKSMELHTTDHGNRKHHQYGEHGEHLHYYGWDDKTGKLIGNQTVEIPEQIRKENKDIL